jgi:hypothetical protein
MGGTVSPLGAHQALHGTPGRGEREIYLAEHDKDVHGNYLISWYLRY